MKNIAIGVKTVDIVHLSVADLSKRQLALVSGNIRRTGVGCRLTEYGELRLGTREASAYYTDNLVDAVGTARAMVVQNG